MSDIKLETRFVGDIKGNFYIPSYQRGYRWGEKEVKRMLNDIVENGGKPYSLQPIVVRNREDRYELVDGQQRLTTLYLIYKCFQKAGMGFQQTDRFSLSYETREKSEQYLADIDLTRREENIDFWHIANAYEVISNYFEQSDDKADAMFTFNQYLKNYVKVIWYEIPEEESAVDLFTRLNIGKIPLTSSELVKALFLRTDATEVLKHQEEISLQWDNIELDLHNDSLWGFLTNEKAGRYATRIDLLLDLMAGKEPDERDEYFTFFYFADRASDGLYDIWKEIQRTFLILKEWHNDHELYHHIGYLIASGDKTLSTIYRETLNLRKSQIQNYLNDEIRKSIDYKQSYDELSYDNREEYDKISRLLLLFNVESVRTIDGGNQWFPFAKHKKANWSLEHIHAQHSEGLESNEKRAEWLKAHLQPLSSLKDEDINQITEEIHQLLDDIAVNPKTSHIGDRFDKLQRTITAKLSSPGNEYIHNIGNMALLDGGDNAALSNYVFDAKRNMVIDWDKQGKYIPYCTKMVFFKYYTRSNENQLHFWGAPDRRAYIEAINSKLAPYLNKPISIDKY